MTYLRYSMKDQLHLEAPREQPWDQRTAETAAALEHLDPAQAAPHNTNPHLLDESIRRARLIRDWFSEYLVALESLRKN